MSKLYRSVSVKRWIQVFQFSVMNQVFYHVLFVLQKQSLLILVNLGLLVKGLHYYHNDSFLLIGLWEWPQPSIVWPSIKWVLVIDNEILYGLSLIDCLIVHVLPPRLVLLFILCSFDFIISLLRMSAIGVAGSCNPNHTPCLCAYFLSIMFYDSSYVDCFCHIYYPFQFDSFVLEDARIVFYWLIILYFGDRWPSYLEGFRLHHIIRWMWFSFAVFFLEQG